MWKYQVKYTIIGVGIKKEHPYYSPFIVRKTTRMQGKIYLYLTINLF